MKLNAIHQRQFLRKYSSIIKAKEKIYLLPKMVLIPYEKWLIYESVSVKNYSVWQKRFIKYKKLQMKVF